MRGPLLPLNFACLCCPFFQLLSLPDYERRLLSFGLSLCSKTDAALLCKGTVFQVSYYSSTDRHTLHYYFQIIIGIKGQIFLACLHASIV